MVICHSVIRALTIIPPHIDKGKKTPHHKSAKIKNMQSTADTFPTIGSLFIESWNLLISRFGKIFGFTVISFLINLIIFALGIGLSFVIVMVSGVKLGVTSNLVTGDVIGAVLAMVAIILPCSFITSAIYNSWLILSLNEKQHVTFSAIFGKGFGFILTLFWIDAISFFFSLGGLFFFLLPALLFAYFFIFVNLEIVCDNQRGIAAFKRSYAITTHNFGEVFVRVLLIIVLNIIISGLTQALSKASPSFVIAEIIIAVLFSWYQMTYIFTLYQQARQRTDFSKPVSFTWIWVITILGWIIFVSFTSVLINLSLNSIKSGILQKMFNSYNHEISTPTPSMQQGINVNNINNVTPAAGAINTFIDPTTAPTVVYNAKPHQQ